MTALTNLPIKSYIWDAFVRVIGVNREKKRIVRQFLPQPGRILEIGCATGNLAGAFRDFDYVGVDTDRQCLQLASWRRQETNFRFSCSDILEDQLPGDPRFDYVLISHTLHHLPDDYARRLVQRSAQLLVPAGVLLVLDMIRPEPGEPFRKQFYYRLDRGEHFRDLGDMRALLDGVSAFEQVDYHVVKTRKLGIEVIDQVAIYATKPSA